MNKINYEFKNYNTNVTVLFLHGWGLSSNSFDKIIQKLNKVSYIKVDLFGFGNSEEPRDYFDVYEYAYQIFLLLRKLQVENLVIVGHSFGGRLSIILSSIFNINIKSIVLTSSAGINRFSIIKWMKIITYKILKKLVVLKIINNKVLIRFGSRDYQSATFVMKKILSRVVNQDLKHLLKYIKCNVYLVWDKKDKDTPYWICRKIHRFTEYSKIILYKSGGHFTAFKNVNKFSCLIKDVVGCRV